MTRLRCAWGIQACTIVAAIRWNQIGKATQIRRNDYPYLSQDLRDTKASRATRQSPPGVTRPEALDLCAIRTDQLQLLWPKPLSGTHSVKLLERDQCLVELTEWLHATAERGGCVGLVAGEAGT